MLSSGFFPKEKLLCTYFATARVFGKCSTRIAERFFNRCALASIKRCDSFLRKKATYRKCFLSAAIGEPLQRIR